VVRVFCFVLAALYAIEVVAHYTFGYQPQRKDAELICTGLAVTAFCLPLTVKEQK